MTRSFSLVGASYVDWLGGAFLHVEVFENEIWLELSYAWFAFFSDI
jgi:hypothetical protein